MERVRTDSQPTVSFITFTTMTHILTMTRVEDWPVMPVEIYQVHFKPSDFFERNPAIDVPSTKNNASVLVEKECCAGEQKL